MSLLHVIYDQRVNCLFKYQWVKIKKGYFQQCCFSVAKSVSLTLCNPMDCSTPGSSIHLCLLEFAQIHVCWVSDAISSSATPFSFCLQSFSSSGSFSMSSCFASGGQSTGASASAIFLPIFRGDFLYDRLVGSPCNPRDSPESSPAPQFPKIPIF